MSDLELLATVAWGHHTPPTTPAEILGALTRATEQAIASYLVLPDGPEPCRDAPDYERVSVTIPLPKTLFDQLMNGATGYRAHYSVRVETGEKFNRELVEAVAPLLVEAEHLYQDKFSRVLCERSLCGSFTKLWHSKELTDPSSQAYLLPLREELRVPHWKAYWKGRPKPRKGLLVPVPENSSVLLNGTFVSAHGEEYEQKPERSKQVHESGWT